MGNQTTKIINDFDNSLLNQFEIENHQASSFEKIPKPLITLIFTYLDAKSHFKMLILNKFFYNLSMHSNFSQKIWQNLCVASNLNKTEVEIEELLKKLLNQNKIKNKFYFYFKYGGKIRK